MIHLILTFISIFMYMLAYYPDLFHCRHSDNQ